MLCNQLDFQAFEDISTRSFSVEMHVIRGDATHHTAAKDDVKAHLTEVRTQFHHPEGWQKQNRKSSKCPDEGYAGPPAADNQSIFPDAQKLPSPCTGVEVRALFLKSIINIGMRPWLDERDAHLGIADLLTGYFLLRIFIFATDQGGDQCGRRRLIKD